MSKQFEITKTYVRWELHEQGSDKTWRRIRSTKEDDAGKAVAELRQMWAGETASRRNLQAFIDLGKSGEVRICKVTVEVTDIPATAPVKPCPALAVQSGS